MLENYKGISRFYLNEEFFQHFICLSNPKPQKKFVRTLWSEFSVSDNMHKCRLLCNNVHAIYSTESLALHSLQDHVYYYSHVVTSIILAQYLQKEDFFHFFIFCWSQSSLLLLLQFDYHQVGLLHALEFEEKGKANYDESSFRTCSRVAQTFEGLEVGPR